MSIKDDAQRAHKNLLGETDSDIIDRINHFAFDEVQKDVDLPDRTKMLSTLGCQGVEEYKIMLPVALDNGVNPVEAKEVLYQAIDYLGLGRVMPFFKVTNEIMTARGIKLPLESQTKTTMDKIALKREKRLKSAYLALK